VNIGDDAYPVAGISFTHKLIFLKVRERNVSGDVSPVEPKQSRGEASQCIPRTLEDVVLAVSKDAPVFPPAPAFRAYLPASQVQAVGAYQPVVVHGHDDGDPRFPAFRQNRGRDEGKQVVDMDDIGLMPGERPADGAPRGRIVYPAKERPGLAEAHAPDFPAAAREQGRLVTALRENGPERIHRGLLAAVRPILVMDDQHLHKSPDRRDLPESSAAKPLRLSGP
jgi:hypothetical protein